jgi:hypothetical protein
MGGSGVLRNWKLPFGIMSLGCFFVYGVQTLLRAMVSPIYPIQRFYLARKWHWMAIADFFFLFSSLCFCLLEFFLDYEK